MNQSNSNFLQTVKAKATGKWLEILPEIDSRLKPAVKHVGHHVPNPVLGGKDGFRLFKDANITGAGVANPSTFLSNGFEVLQYTLDQNFTEVLHKVANVLDVGNWKETPASVYSNTKINPYQIDPKTLNKRRESLRKVWKSSLTLKDKRSEVAIRYFINRGINVNKLNLDDMSKTVRFVPSLAFWHDKKCLGYFPAIISLVSYPDGKAATIHRTYLTKYGEKLSLGYKGDVLANKKMMAACESKTLSGSAIKIGSPNENLHITEGLETALAVSTAKNVNVWPCVSAALLGNLEPPKNVKRIFVWGDKDRKIILPNGKTSQAGYDSAMKLSERMEDRNIHVISLFPKQEIQSNQKGIDWLDVLVNEGEEAFPNISQYLNL